LPIAQRKCADTTAKLVLAAARRTREKIREKGRRNRPTPRPATGAPAPTGSATDPKPQLSGKKRAKKSHGVTTTVWQPRDNHYPHRTEHKGRSAAVCAGHMPDDIGAPEGIRTPNLSDP